MNRPLLEHIVNVGRRIENVAHQRLCMLLAICCGEERKDAAAKFASEAYKGREKRLASALPSGTARALGICWISLAAL